MTNDPYVLSIVAKGYKLRFTSPPLLRQTPWEIRSPQDPQEILGMWEQISLMLQKNSITEVPPNSPGFYSNVFLVRKASGGWRPVIDLKSLNAHIHAPHFRMFTTNSVLSSVQRGDYAFKIDLQDAYFHVPIHPSSRKYLRFAFENRVYQFQVLPFGLNTAPHVFTRLGHTVTGYLHSQGISVIPYLDDWLIHHPDPKVLLRHQAQLMNTLDLVGFVLNRKKSELDLTQDIQFLGIHLRLDLGETSLPDTKAWEIVALAHHLSSLHVLSYTQVSQFMGSLNWASGLIPLGRLYLRPLQRHFHSLDLTDRFTPPRRSDPLVTFYGAGRTHVFLPQKSLSACFRRSSRFFLRTPPRRGGALTWGIPRFRVPGPIQTASSTSVVWSSRRYFMPYSIGLKCSKATRL